MGMSTGGGGDGFLAEINVTPFVDVMLVLLIIFMVTAPMMTQGLEVDLPKTQTVTTLPETSENLVLTIKKDGSLYLDEYPVSFDDLAQHVRRLVTDQKKLLFLRADKDVPYGTVVRVMGSLKGAGVDKLGMVAEPEAVKEEKPQGRPKK
ncbi:Biopolymer transport protein ExbD [Fundidesulfovibrio magnetotacticus]|uniref:Biopolymer transport protein ExbD n=1 Tax=Fundidesulfovibrio magnetotacticus TaxID=2730080 RepID=A0A6V8LVY4_9BACT|nr:protein TolR [Fundidesulfovibrio magnetotacticus]GFK92425.1 Biopolymer transport protein ExbD [Fundidesulfovibrio magnetotacticus]